MKRKFSIYHFLVALMMFTLILPAFAGADNSDVRTTGTLTIHKFEREPGVEDGEDGDGSAGQNVPTDAEKLEGVTFKITQTHSYNPESDKWTSTTSGSTYEETTNDQGQVVFNNLPLGRYTVEEIEGPAHVVLNDEVYSVDIPMTSKDGSSINYDVHIYPKNETIRGGVVLTKTDGDSKKALEGVTFSLFEEGNDTAIKTGLQTDAEGKITVDGLGVGHYYFQETATLDGYLLNKKKVTFEVKNQNEEVTVQLENFVKPEVEKEVNKDAVNRGETVTYTITVHLPGDIADYESFVITDVLHEHLEYVDGSQSDPEGFTFNQDGQTLTWTANPSELEPGTVEITFNAVISRDAEANEPINNEASIDYNNSYESGGSKTPGVPVTPTAGSLTVIKQDGNDNEKKLAGAEFVLKDADGNEVATGTSGDDGTVDFDGATDELDYGSYTLHETKAPEGYRMLLKPIDIVVNAENNVQTITVDNYESGWQLPKTGGIGTMLFTFIGLSLMGTASYMYTRRRKGETV